MQPIIVEASEAWPAVVAGLGSALIVALITLYVARKQRKADREGLEKQLKAASTRLDRQLAWDRKLRDREMKADAERLDKQLAQDRELREQQTEADSARLEKQLEHDRDARDLQLLRETLAPIMARALDWDKFTSLHKGLSTVGDVSANPESAWVKVILPLVSEVAVVAEQLRRDARTLVIVDGLYSRVAAVGAV